MTNLSKQHAWLPDWPNIWETGPHEYLVEGRHVSYNRYRLAQWIVRLAILAYLYHVFTVQYHAEYLRHEFTYSRQLLHDQWHWPTPAVITFLHLLACAVVVTLFPVARWLSRICLRQNTRVGFTRGHIAINGKQFAVLPHIAIQFCAYRLPLAERYIQREHFRQADYLIRFRIIDMIYGARVVPIASIDDEEKANQFVIALQMAFEGSQSPEVPFAERAIE